MFDISKDKETFDNTKIFDAIRIHKLNAIIFVTKILNNLTSCLQNHHLGLTVASLYRSAAEYFQSVLLKPFTIVGGHENGHFHDKNNSSYSPTIFPKCSVLPCFLSQLDLDLKSQTVYPLDELHQLSCLLSYPSKELFLCYLSVKVHTSTKLNLSELAPPAVQDWCRRPHDHEYKQTLDCEYTLIIPDHKPFQQT